MIYTFAHSSPSGTKRRAFTLVELLAVIGIIIVLVGITIPAIKSLAKSNDQSQATNLIRSMITAARSIAVSQHRPAGVVFFEETSQYSLPVNSGQTAMQIFVEDYNQNNVLTTSGFTGYVYYSTARQYLPAGIRVAALTDNPASNVETGDTRNVRAILFDANGQLVLRSGLSTTPPSNGTQKGAYPLAYGDWHFLIATISATPNLSATSPGFFVYSKNEYDAQPAANRLTWLKQNAAVIVVNGNTGGILR